MRISGISSLFLAIAVFSAHLLHASKTLRSLRKERKTQKSSLISKEKVNKVVHIFRKLVHIFRELVHIFGELVHIFAWKLVYRTSKQVSRNLGPFMATEGLP